MPLGVWDGVTSDGRDIGDEGKGWRGNAGWWWCSPGPLPLFPRISSSGEALRDYSCCGVASVFAGPLGTRSARRHFELATFLFLFRHPVCRERG